MHTANWIPAAVYPREGADGNDIVSESVTYSNGHSREVCPRPDRGAGIHTV